MAVTDELRAMLDRRGVEWDEDATESCGHAVLATFWNDSDGYPCAAIEGTGDIPDGEVCINACVTPAQAIAATLGSETCHITVEDNLAETEGMGDVWIECDKCHWQMPLEPTTPRFNYCPNCGRKVVG